MIFLKSFTESNTNKTREKIKPKKVDIKLMER